MANLTTIEKSSNNYRIKHPNFGDVLKTTYGKGVIKDFAIGNLDPFQAKSMVVVEGDWGESDFIPIFYRPKEKYWDDAEHSAIDFNETAGYYGKAWQSFRYGDEVKVMLKEDVPVAVVGFYDVPPRVGQDIIKFSPDGPEAGNGVPFNFPVYFQASNGSIYLDATIGPNGETLNLTKESAYSNVSEASQTTVFTYYLHPGDPGYDPYNQPQPYSFTVTTTFHYREFYTLVGPILYIFQILWVSQVSVSERPDVTPSVSSPPSIANVSCRAMIYKGTIPLGMVTAQQVINYSNQDPPLNDGGACEETYGNMFGNSDFGTHYYNSYHQGWVGCFMHHDLVPGVSGFGLYGLTGLDGLHIYTVPRNEEA